MSLRPPLNGNPESLGWVKLHRGILLHRLWDLPASHVKVGLTTLLLVGHKAARVWNGRDEMALAAGEVVTSQEAIARAAGNGITRRVVQRAIRNLSAVGFLKVRPSAIRSPRSVPNAPAWCGRGIVVSISNWERYQGEADEGGAVSVRSRCARGSVEVHKQEVKKGRREEEGTTRSSETAAPVPPAVLAVFVEEFDREPTKKDHAVMAQLGDFPLDAVRAAFRETHERGLDLTYAQAVLRFTPATAEAPAGGAS